ncbi:MAG: riboflavin biosynthesis protein RibF [Legionellales bacterium]|nr:riboflavin biosynthesis protein RibF [Legionellales bacterium]OUX67712.1 MAG: riboflavin biosynthesis protein RibF [bacterium TMED178]
MIVSRWVPHHKDNSLLIGNYDGVHIGHQHLIRCAQKVNRNVTLLTFAPHPRLFFKKNFVGIQSFYDKLLFLKAYGVSCVYVIPFTTEIARCSAKSFIDQFIAPLSPKAIIVGSDFKFGHNREGDGQTLRQYFDLIQPDDITIGPDKVSSTLCRRLLHEGHLEPIKQMMNRPFHVSGIVRHGQHLGRTLGYPTANLHAPEYPLSGIYAGTVILPDRTRYYSAISVGHRPMAPVPHGMLEAHLLDYDGDLYGKRIHVIFHHKIRDQMKLEDFNALKIQMQIDEHDIRSFFKKNANLS